IESAALGVKPQAQHAKTNERVAAALPQVAHALLCRKAYFNGAHQLGSIVGMNLHGRSGIEFLQDAMQVRRAFFSRSLPQPFPQLLRTRWAGEKPFQKRAQIESGAAHNNGQTAALLDLAQGSTRAARVITCSERIGGGNDVQQVRWNKSALLRCGLSSPDFKIAVDRHGVAVDNLAMKARGQCQRERGFA